MTSQCCQEEGKREYLLQNLSRKKNNFTADTLASSKIQHRSKFIVFQSTKQKKSKSRKHIKTIHTIDIPLHHNYIHVQLI